MSDGLFQLKTNLGQSVAAAPVVANTWYQVFLRWHCSTYTNYELTVMDATGTVLFAPIALPSANNNTVNYVGFAGSWQLSQIGDLEFYTLDAADTVAAPNDIVAPPTGPFTWYVRDDAIGNSTGLANTPAGAFTWKEVTDYGAMGLFTEPSTRWLDASGNAFDATRFTDSEMISEWRAGGIRWNGSKVVLGTDISGAAIAGASYDFAGPVEFDGQGHTIDCFVPLTATATPYDAANYPKVWVVPSGKANAALYEDGKCMHAAFGTGLTAPGTESGTPYASVREAINRIPGTYW
ncbi:MAG: hypothetical protein ACHRHE_20510, partial [Tepidisphaerales bacterium]